MSNTQAVFGFHGHKESRGQRGQTSVRTRLFSLFTDPQSSSSFVSELHFSSTKAARVTRCLIHQRSHPVLAYRAAMLLLLLFMEPPR